MTLTDPLFILYGSATGNAEHIAKTLAESATAAGHYKNVICCELNDYKKQCLKYWEQEPKDSYYGVLIVTSTTGNGDAPENASRFVRFIKRNTSAKDLFAFCKFGVLALGDTNYDQFCAAGKLVDRKLAELGGKRIRPVATADEGTGLEDVVEPWCDTILSEVVSACRGTNAMNGIHIEKSSVEVDRTASATAEPANDPSPAVETATKKTDDDDKSLGVRLIQSLLNVSRIVVDSSTLPSLATCRSSCELVHHPPILGKMSIGDETTSSVSSVYYTLNRPYLSKILGARYLTQTSTVAANRVANECDVTTATGVDQALEIISSEFDLSKNERNGKRVIELALSVPIDYSLEYAPGDSLGLKVPNTNAAVNYILELLKTHHQISPDQLVSIDANHPVTIRDAIKYEIDLSGPISGANKRIFLALSKIATNPLEQTCLELLSSKCEEAERVCQVLLEEQRWNFFDLLRAFPSLRQLSITDLLSIVPALPPRYYSVSSSPLEPTLKIAFSVVDYCTPSLTVGGTQVGQRRVHGVATGWMEVLASPLLAGQAPLEGVALPIFPKPSADFRLPITPSNLILIGPGTGIAPFMGFLRQKSSDSVGTAAQTGMWRGGFEIQEDEIPDEQIASSIDVFFGCRHRDHDWLYRQEMEEYQSDKLIRLHLAFSRDGDTDCRYVQDSIRKEKTMVLQLITAKQAVVYLCGDGNKMAKDVQTTLVELLAEQFGEIDKATAYFKDMKKKRRFFMDIWM